MSHIEHYSSIGWYLLVCHLGFKSSSPLLLLKNKIKKDISVIVFQCFYKKLKTPIVNKFKLKFQAQTTTKTKSILQILIKSQFLQTI